MGGRDGLLERERRFDRRCGIAEVARQLLDQRPVRPLSGSAPEQPGQRLGVGPVMGPEHVDHLGSDRRLAAERVGGRPVQLHGCEFDRPGEVEQFDVGIGRGSRGGRRRDGWPGRPRPFERRGGAPRAHRRARRRS